jgi:hypothetical protein
VSFGDLTHFYRVFKKLTGLNPQAVHGRTRRRTPSARSRLNGDRRAFDLTFAVSA